MMLPLGASLPDDDAANQWRFQLNRFVQDYQVALAAIAWGLQQEWQDADAILGIDLLPQAHFICASRSQLEILNQKVDNQVQEILGILDGYDPQTEVTILAIGPGQLKLLFFKPNSPPQACFEQETRTLDTLITELEEILQKILSIFSVR
jgi:hypothetical protein